MFRSGAASGQAVVAGIACDYVSTIVVRLWLPMPSVLCAGALTARIFVTILHLKFHPLRGSTRLTEAQQEPMMQKQQCLIAMTSAALLASNPLLAEEKAKSPADGYSIHLVAPHRHEDGTVHGPHHHCCKSITPAYSRHCP